MSITSNLASFARSSMPSGVHPKLGARPQELLVLYEFEACPFCRKVREAISHLDLDTEVRPCPKNGARFRAPVKAEHARATFPFLIDPNTGKEMFESADIVRYLYDTYADGDVPRALTSPTFLFSSQLASLVRGASGALARKGAPPAQLPILEGMENDPVARVVRERLCEREIPYVRRTSDVVRLIDEEASRVVDGVDAAQYVVSNWSG